MKVIDSEKIPIKIWTDTAEDGALEQAKALANLPFARKWIAIMPDTHQGYGMPIGGVVATQSVVIPNAVGVDIGCGALKNGAGEYCIDCRDKRISEKRRKYNDEYYRKLRVKK